MIIIFINERFCLQAFLGNAVNYVLKVIEVSNLFRRIFYFKVPNYIDKVHSKNKISQLPSSLYDFFLITIRKLISKGTDILNVV